MDGSSEQTNANTNERRDSGSSSGSGSGSGSGSDSVLTSDTERDLPRMVLITGAIAVIGIVVTGVMVYALDRVGPAGSADVMWIMGYGLTIFVLWYLLVRPIDFSKRY
ncbi:hypothetical protein [Halocatena salina]|uniref:Uncharacterized protein n=1 Tax=Halocatena salina TaxID=2934340 RepID=A0A8U0A1D2_9EURY|nr:hypothetical protein [Halocatena salina]UPM42248.1 hypothetical protein MW046_09790 [Halocatena salina]